MSCACGDDTCVCMEPDGPCEFCGDYDSPCMCEIAMMAEHRLDHKDDAERAEERG